MFKDQDQKAFAPIHQQPSGFVMTIDGLPVYWPFGYVYPEQYRYMKDLKSVLDSGGHCILEMPSGTGKTIALVALILSHMQLTQSRRRLIYLTRTVAETQKVHAEVRRVASCINEHGEQTVPIKCIGISSRMNLCINKKVSCQASSWECDSACRDLTAGWARESAREVPDIEICGFYHEFDLHRGEDILQEGVHSLDDIREEGRRRGICPYHLALDAIRNENQQTSANVVVGCYAYLLDPRISEAVGIKLSKSQDIIVFDEAHNIDNTCMDSLTVELTRVDLDICQDSIIELIRILQDRQRSSMDRLQKDYEQMVNEIQSNTNRSIDGAWIQDTNEDPVPRTIVPKDVIRSAMPGNIRQAEYFLAFLKRWLGYIRSRFRANQTFAESPSYFLLNAAQNAKITDVQPLLHLPDRLHMLLNTLAVPQIYRFHALQQLCNFAATLGTYTEGFSVVMDGVGQERGPNYESIGNTTFADESQYIQLNQSQSSSSSSSFIPVKSPSSTSSSYGAILRLCCHDPRIVFKPITDEVASVIITSGTLSPLAMYPKLLGITPKLVESYSMTVTRQCALPMIVTRGADQLPISTRFALRNDHSVMRNYGFLLNDVAESVPDGIVAFFPSYKYLEDIVVKWNEQKIINKIYNNKLVFIETQDPVETGVALTNFRLACDAGRGAVFLCVCRGKVSEGIDCFEGHYGRCVICFGVPFISTESLALRERLSYLRTTHGIKESEYLCFDAIRAAAQCVGRVLRSKDDYGVMIFADRRFALRDKRSKLPQWISAQMREGHHNLSTEMAAQSIRLFLRQMAQHVPLAEQLGKSLWTVKDIEEEEVKEQQSQAALEAEATQQDKFKIVIPIRKQNQQLAQKSKQQSPELSFSDNGAS